MDAGRGRRTGAEGPRQPRLRSVAERPRQFLIQVLEAVRAARRGEAAMPGVLDEADVEAVFRMLDAAGRGFVTGRQCREGRSAGAASPRVCGFVRKLSDLCVRFVPTQPALRNAKYVYFFNDSPVAFCCEVNLSKACSGTSFRPLSS